MPRNRMGQWVLDGRIHGQIVGHWGDEFTEKGDTIPRMATLIVRMKVFRFKLDGEVEETTRDINISGPLKPAPESNEFELLHRIRCLRINE
jgi:hypothetical protein